MSAFAAIVSSKIPTLFDFVKETIKSLKLSKTTSSSRFLSSFYVALN